MSPKLKLPSVSLHCPGCSNSSDFIALDCPQFGNRIGDSCPALPSVAHRIGDTIGDEFPLGVCPQPMRASFHAGFSMVFGLSSVKPISSQASQGLRACVQKTTESSSRPKRPFNSGHSKEQPVGMIKQRHKLVVQVEGTGSVIQCVDDYTD